MRVGPAVNVARVSVDELITALWTFANAQGLLTDDINERTAAAGVTIDGTLIRDLAIGFSGLVSPANRVLGSDVVGDAEERFRLHAGGIMQWGDGAVARDTDLFRAAANLLATADSFRVAGVLGLVSDIITERTASAGVTIDSVLLKDRAIDFRGAAAAADPTQFSGAAGDSDARFLQRADGSMAWGPGDAAGDTELRREAANELGTPDDFNVGGTLDLAAEIELSIRTVAPIVADQDDFGTGTTVVQRISSTVPIDITGFAGGVDGRMIIILNWNVQLITLKHLDVGSASANRMQLPGSADIVLSQNDAVTMFYEAVNAKWQLAGSAL